MTSESDTALKYTFLILCTHKIMCARVHTHGLYGLNGMIYYEFFHQHPDLTDRGIHTEQTKNVLLLG